jgi:hypothetical protein
MASVRRPRGILNMNKEQTVSVTGRATAMCDGIDESPMVFPSPTVSTATVRNQVTTVNQYESKVKSRAIHAAARNVQRNLLSGCWRPI